MTSMSRKSQVNNFEKRCMCFQLLAVASADVTSTVGLVVPNSRAENLESSVGDS